MEEGVQLHTPAAVAPGKKPKEPIKYEAGWVPEPVWTWWRGEKSLALTEI